MFAASRSIHKGLKNLHFSIYSFQITHTHIHTRTNADIDTHTYIPIRTPPHTHTSSIIEHYYFFITTHSSRTHGNGASDREQVEGGLLRNGDEHSHLIHRSVEYLSTSLRVSSF
jgi:hypothetical protein